MGFIFIILVVVRACLNLINTLFSPKIEGLYDSGFGLTSKGFGSVL